MYTIDIQLACKDPLPFNDDIIKMWASKALLPHLPKAELTLRFIEKEEMQSLNFTYRKKNKPTNVLAFKSSHPPHIALDYPFIGDVVICPEVLFQESIDEKTPLEAHFAHIVIHGVLHLLGFDHILKEEEEVMRQLETALLCQLGYDNPYNKKENINE